MRASAFAANVVGFIVGTAPILWMILRSPRYLSNSYRLDNLFAFPLWPSLILGAAFVLIALRRGRLAIGLIAGSLLNLGLVFILAAATLAEA